MEEPKRPTDYKQEIRTTLFSLLKTLTHFYFKADQSPKGLLMSNIGDGYDAILGSFEKTEMIGKVRLQDLIHPNETSAFKKRLDQSIQSGNKINDIVQLNPQYQEKKWVWITGKGTFNHNRELDSIEGHISDITEQKNTVDGLRKQENFYFHILNHMPIELVVLNAQHRYIFVSKSAISDDEIREWIIGKTDFEYCEYRNKDINIAWERRRNFERLKEEKKEMEWEEIFTEADGRKIYVLRRMAPIFDQDGDLQMVIGYGFDITKRRTVEERASENEKLLKSINDNLQDGIYRYSPDEGFLYINDAFARIFNYANRNNLMNDSQAFFDFDQEARKELLDIKGKTGSFNNKELLLKRQDGSQFWGLVNCKKNVDENHRVIFDGAIGDITELKETERLLKQKNQELRKANKELDQFIYSASHDLRAPLTSILGVVHVLELEFDEPEIVRYVSMVKDSVQKLDDFVQDLIDYYRNSRSTKSKEAIDFDNIIQECIDNFRYLEGADQINFTPEVNLQNTFYSDKYRIKIILNNLISNAIKYYNPKNSNPFVHLKVFESDGQLIIEFNDNGKGIKEENLGRIFEMFYRAASDSKSSGLGLYIVKEAVEKLNGTIEVDSKLGEGTRFTIYLNKQ